MGTLVFVSAVVAVFSLFGAAGAWLGRQSGRALDGFLWGFIAGPPGWVAPALWTVRARTWKR